MKNSIKIITFFVILIYNLFVQSQTLQMLSSTFLGGNDDDRAHDMAIDKQGNVYITAPIRSLDFPITETAIQKNFTGVYLTKMNSTFDSL